MHRRFVLALAMTLLAVWLPATASAQDQVTVTITCPPVGNPDNRAPVEHYAPDPYRRELTQDSTWVLNINRPNTNNYVRIEPKPGQPWPYTGASYSNDAGRNGRLVIPAAEFAGQEGTFYYQIVYACEGVEHTIDPRMDVGGGGGE